MKNRIQYVLVVLTLLLATTAQAEVSYLLFPPYGAGGHRAAAVKENFINLLQGSMTQKGTRIVVANDSCRDADCAVDEANGEYNYAVIIQLAQLGYYYKCIASVIDTKTGEVVFKTDAAKATEEEMDILAKRVSESLLDRQSFAGTIKRGEGVAQENEGPRLKNVQMLYGFGVGVAYPFKGVDKSETQASFDTMIGANVDKWQAMFYMPIRFNASGSGKNTEIGFDLLTKYHLMNTFASPFLAVGMGAHILRQTGFNSKVGFAAMGGGGVTLFRTSKIEMPFMFLYQYLAIPSLSDPQSIVATVGIYF